MKTVVCVPRWPGDVYRDEAWNFVQRYIHTNFPHWDIIEGHEKDPGVARNAAANSCAWDVAIFWDADNLAHAAAVFDAWRYTQEHKGRMAIAGDSFMYMSRESSRRIIEVDPYWFPRPAALKWPASSRALFPRPCTGVYAVSRRLWEDTGGFIDGRNGGWEDLIFYECCNTFGDGVFHVPEHILLHLWHPSVERVDDFDQPTTGNGKRNQAIWKDIQHIRRRNRLTPLYAQRLVREYLNGRT